MLNVLSLPRCGSVFFVGVSQPCVCCVFMFDVVLEEDWGPNVCGQTSYRMICLEVACATGSVVKVHMMQVESDDFGSYLRGVLKCVDSVLWHGSHNW